MIKLYYVHIQVDLILITHYQGLALKNKNYSVLIAIFTLIISHVVKNDLDISPMS